MPGLILKLRPFEAFLVNGVVIENGDKRAQLRVKTDGASILRMRHAMKPEEATTPALKAYYVAQLAVAGEIAEKDAADILAAALLELEMADRKGLHDDALRLAGEELAQRRFYWVMRALGGIARPAAL